MPTFSVRAHSTSTIPYDHSRDDFLELEKLTDPLEGLISYYVTVTRNYGPYIKVLAANGTVGDYRIRIVYDPVQIWSGNEREQGDLPHDDTTWATVAIDGGTAEIGVYHYYDDHDWFAVELEEDETYRDSYDTAPDDLGHDTGHRHRGEALRLFDGNELEI